MYINPERSQVVDFIPYLRVGNQLLVAKGNPAHIGGIDDLCGHRIVVPVGTMYEKEAQAKAAECQPGGKPALTVMSLTSTAVGALSIKEGRADVLIASTPTDAALIKESPDAFETTGPTFENNTLLGIGVSKDKSALKRRARCRLQGDHRRRHDRQFDQEIRIAHRQRALIGIREATGAPMSIFSPQMMLGYLFSFNFLHAALMTVWISSPRCWPAC
jgi:hypothetical protein